MFTRWNTDPETGRMREDRVSYDPETFRSSSHQACDRCHSKKLKCSGEKEGCSRCVTQGLSCKYTRSASRTRRTNSNTKKDGRLSESSRRSESKSPRSSTTSETSSKRGSRQQPPSSRPRGINSSAGDALGQFDISLLSPDDAFEFDHSFHGHHHHHHHHQGSGHIPVASSSGYLDIPTSQAFDYSSAPGSTYGQWPEMNYPCTTAAQANAYYSTSQGYQITDTNPMAGFPIYDPNHHHWQGDPHQDHKWNG